MSLRNLIISACALLLPVACTDISDIATRAEAGDPKAQFRYAQCFMYGEGTAQNPQQALHWFEKAALKGHRNAATAVGLCYATGVGTKQDYRKARRFLQYASDWDHPRAQLILAQLYAKGLGTSRDPEKAVENIRYSAMQGHPKAALLMFFCFYEGFGVPKHELLAIGWLENAAEYDSDEAKTLLKLYKNPKKRTFFEEKAKFYKNKLDFFPKKG